MTSSKSIFSPSRRRWVFCVSVASIFLVETAVAAETKGGAASLLSMLPLVGIVGIWYLMVLRPKVTEERNHNKLVSELAPGTKILLSSGIYGVVAAVKDDKLVEVEIAKNVVVETSTDYIESKVA